MTGRGVEWEHETAQVFFGVIDSEDFDDMVNVVGEVELNGRKLFADRIVVPVLHGPYCTAIFFILITSVAGARYDSRQRHNVEPFYKFQNSLNMCAFIADKTYLRSPTSENGVR